MPTRVLGWLVIGALSGVACGCGSALFLWLLELATQTRLDHRWLVWGLPLAGLALGLAYERFGEPVKGGNNLVIDTIHDGGPEIPLRMAPLVMVGTVLTHLFGGSAGREGTAVQMGASLTDFVSHRLRISGPLRTELLAAGVAGGFGSVFGTPWAGAMFGLEFVAVGRLQWKALVPVLVASFVGDRITRAWGIEHTAYPALHPVPIDLLLLGKWALFAGAVALTAIVFIELTHRLKTLGRRLPLRMASGGATVVLLWLAVGRDDFLGLGVPTIVRAFSDASLPWWAFAAKLLFTAVTLGAGFLGGEVTPLFFIGATLGNALARALGLPLDLAAGVGLAATFAAAANTPLALSIMAVELMGAAIAPHVLLVSVLAWMLTGRRSIYTSQRQRF